jgi:hypothetical protein
MNTPGPADPISPFPYRMAFAGGWIDQPFISRLLAQPPGSMVVVGIEPTLRFMDRAGMATGTRRVALCLWGGAIPDRDPARLTRELYAEENRHLADPSGSQDMIGLLYPGVNRLDFDPRHEGGYFPIHIESNRDPAVADWIENNVQMLAVNQRPDGYSPLGVKNLDPDEVARLGQTGRACFDALVSRNAPALGAAMNDCMRCWENLLPHTVRHPLLPPDLPDLLRHYQDRSHGAMFSGCGGGYFYIVSETLFPGAFRIRVRR